MAKSVVIHEVPPVITLRVQHGLQIQYNTMRYLPTNWRINRVANCIGRIMGEVIGVRWLLNERRSSLVSGYLSTKQSLLGAGSFINMSGKKHSMVAYR